MILRSTMCLALVAAASLPARALEISELPMLAQDAVSFSTSTERWAGAELAGWRLGFAPGGAIALPADTSFFSMNMAFEDKSFVSVRSMAGFAPTLAAPGFSRGFDFSSTQVQAGYTLGAVRPWVSAAFASMTPNRFGGAQGLPGDPYTLMFKGSGERSFATVGAGVDFSISPNVTLGVGVTVGTANGFDPMFAGPGGLRAR